VSSWTALVLWLVPIVAADAFFPTVPAEVAVATAGSLAADGRVNLVVVILLSALGSWIGDAALYFLFRRSLSPLVDRWRWGRRLHDGTREAIEQLGKAGAFAMVVGPRFLPGGRLASSATAGLMGLPVRGYLVSDAVGGLLWSTWMAGAAFATDTTTNLPFWASALVGAGGSTLLASGLASYLAWRRRQRRPRKEAVAAAAAPPTPAPIGPAAGAAPEAVPSSPLPQPPRASAEPTPGRRPPRRRRTPPRRESGG
jgi:membrane protein DedA with SNARE-associated domain